MLATAQPTVATPVGPRTEQPPILRIGLIADAQYWDGNPDKGRYYRLSLEKLHQAVDTLNAREVDLVINLGDLIDQNLASYHRALLELARLEMPVQNVLGNHEFWQIPFQNQASILDTLGLSQAYCAVEYPGWRLIMLDGTELAAYAQGAHRELTDEAELCRGSLSGYPNNALWNGAVGQAQMAWLDAQLREADALGQRALLFCHFPIDPPGHGMTLWNDADLKVLLGRHRSPEAWLAGHSHEGGYAHRDGVHHLTLAGMLMTPDSNAFAILNLYADRMVLEGFGREPSRILPLKGSRAEGAALRPEAKEKPDAMPIVAPACIDQTIVTPMGASVFSTETDSISALQMPRLFPGIYALKESKNGHSRYGRIAVFQIGQVLQHWAK